MSLESREFQNGKNGHGCQADECQGFGLTGGLTGFWDTNLSIISFHFTFFEQDYIVLNQKSLLFRSRNTLLQ